MSSGRQGRAQAEAERATPLRDAYFPRARGRSLEGADRPMRDAFLREMWIASRVRSPFVGEVLQVKADRQTRLYLVMPFYQGELLDLLQRAQAEN